MQMFSIATRYAYHLPLPTDMQLFYIKGEINQFVNILYFSHVFGNKYMCINFSTFKKIPSPDPSLQGGVGGYMYVYVLDSVS